METSYQPGRGALNFSYSSFGRAVDLPFMQTGRGCARAELRVCETHLAPIQAAPEPIGQLILEGTSPNRLLANDICRP